MPILADSTPLLSIDAIDVHYGAVQALYGVSLAVHAGEVVSVLGGNASSVQSAHLRRAERFIRHNLADPDLPTQMIA